MEMNNRPSRRLVALGCAVAVSIACARAAEPLPRAFIDGTGPGWQAVGEDFFINVNCDPGTWTWTNGMAHCTGRPIGVIRSTKLVTNLELVVEWRHLQAGGNSGVFLWATP